MKIDRPTWLDPRVEIRDSPTHGRGAFAKRPIRAGEIVTVWAHAVLGSDDLAAEMQGELHERPDGSWVWLPDSWANLEGYDPAEEYLNHSCDPNVWMDDEVTLSARRDITPEEELTGDYALWEVDPDYVSTFECRCGSRLCRGRVTGRDWESSELRRRYAGHWHPALERRIAELSGRSDDSVGGTT